MTNPTMTNWIVTYNDHSSAGAVMAAATDVYAAYYDCRGHLVEFKDSDHQVVFSLHAGIVLTISRAGDAVDSEASA